MTGSTPEPAPAPARLAPVLRAAATAAARAALAIREAGRLDTRRKADRSPVSAGDLAANDEITSRLRDAFPGIPVVSEESGDRPRGPVDRFFLVDPIDGTRDYIRGGKDFTVNIALVEAGRPVAGIVLSPVRREGLLAAGDGAATWLDWRPDWSPGETRPLPREAPAPERRAVVSRSHLDPATRDWLAAHRFDSWFACGSSWKFCLLARRQAFAYPRLAPLHDWDIAAGHAVLAAAGGRLVAADGESPVRYRPDDSHVAGFLAHAPGTDTSGESIPGEGNPAGDGAANGDAACRP